MALIKRIRAEARRRGVDWRPHHEGANHTIFYLGETMIPVPRHAEGRRAACRGDFQGVRAGTGEKVVEAMKTYRATVTRDGKFWLVKVPKIRRVTQARHLRELEAMTTDLIAVMTAEPPGSFSVEYHIQLPKAVRTHLEAARALRQKAARAQADAAVEARQAARALRAQGIPLRDIGRALGISHQRAHQLAS